MIDILAFSASEVITMLAKAAIIKFSSIRRTNGKVTKVSSKSVPNLLVSSISLTYPGAIGLAVALIQI
jgi:hypothetical protein